MFTRPFFTTATRARRMITGLALLAYVMSVVGYPLPLSAGPQDTSVPFPCQGHACGCRTAAQCLDNCCCHTAAERLAWARNQAAKLPAGTMAMLARKAAEEVAEDSEAETSSCCQRASKCCDEKPTAAVREIRGQGKGGIVWINAIQAQKCQGLTTLWIANGANLPLEIRPLWEFEWAPAGDAIPMDDDSVVVYQQPDLRPPRA